MSNTLDAMPKVVMEKILGGCNYADCQSLRKSCSRLRSLVDLLKPDPKIKAITCQQNDLGWALSLTFLDEQSVNIYYGNKRGGCAVTNRKKQWDVTCRRRFFESSTVDSVFFPDFKALKTSLSHQSTPLEQLDLISGEGYLPLFQENLAPILAELPLLRVTTLHIILDNVQNFPPILPLVSSEDLQSLKIMASDNEEEGVLNVDGMVELEQWRGLRSFQSFDFPISDPTSVANIPCSILRMHSISLDQLMEMKETFQHSTTLDQCLLVLDDSRNALSVVQAIAPDEAEDDIRGPWYPTVRPEKMLRIVAILNNLLFHVFDSSDLENHQIVHH